MSGRRFACLPWYDLPETREAQDALWSVIADHLERQGIDAVPDRLTRARPVVELLADPRLLLGQCCGYDVVYGFSGAVVPIATPQYVADGCSGSDYSSFVLVRADSGATALADLRGSTCAVNGFNSHSGTNALRALVAPLSRNGRFFGAVKVSGAHVASLELLAAGEADVMAMDCVVHALLAHYRPEALTATRILAATAPAPAPPLVVSASAGPALVAMLKSGLANALADEAARAAMASLLIGGIAFRPLGDYARIVEVEGAALAYGYRELHATSEAVVR